MGLQIHAGPRDYDDSDEVATWVLDQGQEELRCFSFRTPNAENVSYAEWEYASRPGMHHTVFSLFDLDLADGAFEDCVHPGTLEAGQFIGTLATAHTISIARTTRAQENGSVGWQVPGIAAGQVQLHAFNFTDRPLLPEAWLNLYFPEQPPTQTARPLRLIGGIDWVIGPNDDLIDNFTCPITSAGRLLSLMAYPLQSTYSVDVWLQRSTGERVHLLQSGLGSEPRSYAYDSVTTNPVLGELADGAHSGMVSFEAGDAFELRCHISNPFTHSLTHVHDETRGAICDLTGMTLGAPVDCAMP